MPQLRDEPGEVQRIPQPQHEIVARKMYGDTFTCLGSRLEGDRCGIQVSDQAIEDGLQVRIGRIAHELRNEVLAGSEQV